MEWTEREAGRRWRQSLCLYLIIAPPHDNAAVTDAATRPRPEPEQDPAHMTLTLTLEGRYVSVLALMGDERDSERAGP